MRLILVYRDSALGDAWKADFGKEPDVEIVEGDICAIPCDAIVSPANSFGFMDGGLDYALSQRFGWKVEEKLRERIRLLPIRELLVGQAMIIPTDDAIVPWLISAPTMRVPMHIKTTINAYLAMKALLATALAHRDEPPIEAIAIPGLGTGVGALPPEVASQQMFTAFREVVRGGHKEPADFGDAQRHHRHLNPLGRIYD
jgi:O-acetyl-ADP-ribose deacetylase (regulator of RNase III)